MIRLFEWLLDHRLLVLLAVSAAVGLSLISASGVSVDYTIEQLFPTTGEVRENFEEYRSAFPDEDTRFTLVWQIDRAPDADLFRNLQLVADHFEDVGLRNVHWMGSVPIPESTFIDGESGVEVHPIIGGPHPSDEEVASALLRHRQNNLYAGYLWNADQTSFGVHGYLPTDRRGDEDRRVIEEELTALLAGIDAPGAAFALAGIPVIRSRLPKLLEADQRLLLGGGLVLFVLLLFFFFRSRFEVLLCLLSAAPAYVLTLGLMGLTGYSISVLSSFIPIIILVVSVSDSIHLLSGFRTSRSDGASPREAVIETFTGLSSTCFYTSLTTAVGFLSLAGTRIGIVVEFGVFTAFSIMAAFVFSMTLLPVLLSYHTAQRFDDRGLQHRWLRLAIDRARVLAIRPSALALSLFLLVSALGVVASRGLQTNTLLLDDMRPRSSMLRDLRWVEDQGFGLFQVVLYMESADGQPLHDPRSLEWMREFQQFAAQDPLVISTVGLPDFLQQLRSGFGGEDGLPRTTEEASQLLFLAQLEDADFSDLVYHPADHEAQIIVSVEDEGSTVILPFLDSIDRYIVDNPPPVGSVAPTGTVYLLQSYQAQILSSFGPTILIAIVLITGILMLMFRSVTLGLVALLPNLFPLLVLTGFMAVFSFDVKPSTILVFSIAFGIAVDDSIHLLGRIRDRLNGGHSLHDAIQDGLKEAGPAIVMATLVVGTGFSLLIGSQFEVLFLVGLMTVVSALASVFADLFALPAILLYLSPVIEHRWGAKSLRIAACVALFSVFGAAQLSAQDAVERGRAIASGSDASSRGYGDLEARLTMVLRSEGSEDRVREIRIRVLEGSGGGDKTLLVFERPRDLEGTALLTHSDPSGSDRHWLYLPAMNRVKRIGSSGQSSSFLGSEFSYEDIGSQELAKYRYRYLESTQALGAEAFLVERTPTDSESGYSRQVVTFDSGTLRIEEIQYFDLDGEHLKTLRLGSYRLYEDRFWRPGEMEMVNHKTGKITVLLWTDYRFGAGFSEHEFDRDRLASASGQW